MLRAKRKRTRMHDKDGNPKFNTMNSTPLQSQYVKVNNNQQQLQNCRCASCENPNSGCLCLKVRKTENGIGIQIRGCNDKIHRNPILGYRNQLLYTGKLPSSPKSAVSKTVKEFCNLKDDIVPKRALTKNTVYKDNYAKTCGKFRYADPSSPGERDLCGYSQVKKHIQNRNGWMNDKYNYSSKQYLERRCRTFDN